MDLFNTTQNSNPTSTSSAVADPEVAEVVEIDLDAEIEAGHPDADINALIPQPPAGKYVLKASLLDRGEVDNPKPGQTKDRKPFITVGLSLKIVDEGSEFHDFELQDYVNSLVQRTRQTSPLHDFLHKIGETVGSVTTLRQLIAKVVATLGEGNTALVNAEIEWKASIKSGPGKYDYMEVFKKMKEFPRDPESDGYLQQATVWVRDYKVVTSNTPGAVTTPVFARAYVSKYLAE